MTPYDQWKLASPDDEPEWDEGDGEEEAADRRYDELKDEGRL